MADEIEPGRVHRRDLNPGAAEPRAPRPAKGGRCRGLRRQAHPLLLDHRGERQVEQHVEHHAVQRPELVRVEVAHLDDQQRDGDRALEPAVGGDPRSPEAHPARPHEQRLEHGRTGLHDPHAERAPACLGDERDHLDQVVQRDEEEPRGQHAAEPAAAHDAQVVRLDPARGREVGVRVAPRPRLGHGQHRAQLLR